MNIEALRAPEVRGKGKVCVLVSDAGKAGAALEEAKIRVGKEEAITVALENRPGAMADVAQKLAGTKVNIECAYATATGPGQATVVLTVSGLTKALSVLGG